MQGSLGNVVPDSLDQEDAYEREWVLGASNTGPALCVQRALLLDPCSLPPSASYPSIQLKMFTQVQTSCCEVVSTELHILPSGQTVAEKAHGEQKKLVSNRMKYNEDGKPNWADEVMGERRLS